MGGIWRYIASFRKLGLTFEQLDVSLSIHALRFGPDISGAANQSVGWKSIQQSLKMALVFK